MPWLLYARAGLLRTFVRAGDESFGTSHRLHTHRHSNNCLFECLVFHHPIWVQCSGSGQRLLGLRSAFITLCEKWAVTAKLCQPGSSTLKVPSREVGNGLVVGRFWGGPLPNISMCVIQWPSQEGGSSPTSGRGRQGGARGCRGLPNLVVSSMERHQCFLFMQMTHTLQRLNFVFQNRINHTCRAVAPALGGAVNATGERCLSCVFSKMKWKCFNFNETRDYSVPVKQDIKFLGNKTAALVW